MLMKTAGENTKEVEKKTVRSGRNKLVLGYNTTTALRGNNQIPDFMETTPLSIFEI